VAELIPFPRRERPEPIPLADQPVAQRPSREELRSADRRRMLENLAALVFIVCLMALAFWVMDRMSGYSHNVTCLSARLKECR
jgi:ferric-dicitrate binding protein FerR (iron transport regulator)